jgi:ketosteroid isomerase-like protein
LERKAMETDPREQVLEAARARAAALAGADADALTRLLHEDFRWTSHTGELFDRDSYMAANTGTTTRWSSQGLGNPEILVVGDTAVLRALVTDEIRDASGVRLYRMPMTQVWVRTHEGWKCLAGHAGPLIPDDTLHESVD